MTAPNISFTLKDFILKNLNDITESRIGIFLDKIDKIFNKNKTSDNALDSDDLQIILEYVVCMMPKALNFILGHSGLIVGDNVLYNAVIRDPSLFELIYDNSLDSMKVTIAAIERMPSLVKILDRKIYNNNEWKLIVNAANNTKPIVPTIKVSKPVTRKYPKELNTINDNILKKQFIENIDILNINWNTKPVKIKKFINKIEMFYEENRLKQKTFIQLLEMVMDKNGTVINFINNKYIDQELKEYQEFSKIKIRNNIIASRRLENMEESDVEFAISTYDIPLNDIMNQNIKLSDNTTIKAIKNKPSNIRFVEKQKEAFCLAAVTKDGTSIEYINKPSEAVQTAAIKNMVANKILIDFYNNKKEVVYTKFNLDSQNKILRKINGNYSIGKTKKINKNDNAQDKADDLNKKGIDGDGSLDEIRKLYNTIKEKINNHLSK